MTEPIKIEIWSCSDEETGEEWHEVVCSDETLIDGDNAEELTDTIVSPMT